MKNLTLLLIALLVGIQSFAQGAKTESPAIVAADGAVMTFTEKTFEYGKVKQGDVVEHTFTFENTGNAPLLITNAKSTCGCTVPIYPKSPILPGETEEIKVRFNTKGKQGKQKKPIMIEANTTPKTTVVYIEGEVETE